MLGEVLDRLNTMVGNPTLTFPMLGQNCFWSKMLGVGSQQFHSFQKLDEMLGRLNTSTNIADIAHALSHLYKNCALFALKDIGLRHQRTGLQ